MFAICVSDSDVLLLSFPSQHKVLLDLQLDADMWATVDGQHTVFDARGFYLVKRINQEFFRLGASPYDRFLVGQYLSSVKVAAFLREKFLVMDTSSLSRPSVRPMAKSGAMALSVSCRRGDIELYITPCISLNEVKIQTHCMKRPYYENLWTVCTHESERNFLDGNGCQRKCLQCVVNAFRKTTELCNVDRDIIVNVWLHLVGHSDMCEERNRSLGDQFIDFVEALREAMDRGTLAQYFNRDVNLLADLSPRFCQQVSDRLTGIIASNGYARIITAE